MEELITDVHKTSYPTDKELENFLTIRKIKKGLYQTLINLKKKLVRSAFHIKSWKRQRIYRILRQP